MSRIARLIGARNVPLLLAAVLGTATFLGAIAWLPSLDAANAPQPVDTVEVVVARGDLSAGERLDAERLRTVALPADAVAAGALRSVESAEGQVLRYPVSAGEQILASKLVGARDAESSGLAFVVPPGMRAVSVPVTEITGAGGLIVPGDRVDVLAAVEETLVAGLRTPAGAPGSDGGPGDAARGNVPTSIVTVLQDALVLAVGQSVGDPAAVARDAGAQRSDDSTPDPEAASVTLAVTPEEAQALFMAVSEGSIGLALRSFGDTSRSEVRPVLDIAPATDRPEVSAQ